MITISFTSEEEKAKLIEEFSVEYELYETCYLFTGNELRFKKKVSGMTVDECLSQQEKKIQEQEQAIADLTMYIATIGV